MQVMLDSVKTAGGDRAKVSAALLNTKVTNGILGTFTINANGDTSSNPVTQYKLVTPGKGVPYKTITPPQSLVAVS
jgi:ABC-type branched-subunit amino acid transport system substrate-binding protein